MPLLSVLSLPLAALHRPQHPPVLRTYQQSVLASTGAIKEKESRFYFNIYIFYINLKLNVKSAPKKTTFVLLGYEFSLSSLIIL